MKITPENKFWVLKYVHTHYDAKVGLCRQLRDTLYKRVGIWDCMIDMQPLFDMSIVKPADKNCFDCWWPFPGEDDYGDMDHRRIALRTLVKHWKELANNKAIKPTKEI